MKKTESKLSVKNTIMIFLSALALVAASLCWFSMASDNDVDSFVVGVDSLSSDFVFYEAVDANRDGTISGTETYVEIQDSAINTQYMVPGQTYFYKAIISNTRSDSNFAFIFNNILDPLSVSEKVIVTAQLLNSSSQTVASTVGNNTIDYYALTDANNVTDATVLTAANLSVGSYELYYTLKLDEATTSDFENKSMTVSDVLLAFFAS